MTCDRTEPTLRRRSDSRLDAARLATTNQVEGVPPEFAPAWLGILAVGDSRDEAGSDGGESGMPGRVSSRLADDLVLFCLGLLLGVGVYLLLRYLLVDSVPGRFLNPRIASIDNRGQHQLTWPGQAVRARRMWGVRGKAIPEVPNE